MDKLIEGISKEIKQAAKEMFDKHMEEKRIPIEEQCNICTNPALDGDDYCEECRAMIDEAKSKSK